MTDRERAIEWARTLPEDALLIDVETTGLRPPVEIVQLAIISLAGETVMDTYIRPAFPIPVAATAIHGITEETVSHSPTFANIYRRIRDAVEGHPVLVYNCSYDTGVLLDCCWRRSLPPLDTHLWQCVMLQYSAFVGEPGRRPGEYRWQRLPPVPGIDAHSALADCLATLEVIRRMRDG